MSDTIHTLKSGRFIVAHWNERTAQWQSSDIGSEPFQGYCYTYARTLEGLAAEGIKTYATRSAAAEAAAECYGPEAAESPAALQVHSGYGFGLLAPCHGLASHVDPGPEGGGHGEQVKEQRKGDRRAHG